MRFIFEIILGCVLFGIFLLILIYVYFFAPSVEALYDDFDNLTPISDLQKRFDTGDLLFFSAKNYTSKVVRWATRSPWSHVGIVVREPGNKEDNLFIWECDIGPQKMGTRYIKLSQKLQTHVGYKVGAWKRLQNGEIDYTKIRKYIDSNQNKGIQMRPYSYLFSRYGPQFLANLFSSKNKWYCSELVARTYQHLGILSEEIDPKSISPNDLYSGSSKKLPFLIDGVRLDDQECVLFRF